MEYIAHLNNLRITQRKVQRVARLVRRLGVEEAGRVLDTMPQRAGLPLGKLIRSAAANAHHNHGVEKGTLYVKSLTVDSGTVFKRWHPVARGSAHPIAKRTSRVTVVLAAREEKKKETKTKASKEGKATEKKKEPRKTKKKS